MYTKKYMPVFLLIVLVFIAVLVLGQWEQREKQLEDASVQISEQKPALKETDTTTVISEIDSP